MYVLGNILQTALCFVTRRTLELFVSLKILYLWFKPYGLSQGVYCILIIFGHIYSRKM